MRGQEGRGRCESEEDRQGNLRGDDATVVRGTVLRIGQHVDLRGAAAVVMMVVVVRVVAVVVDLLAGHVAQHPDKVPAPVFVTGVDAEAHVTKHIGDG